MKKLFTLAAAVLFATGMWAKDATTTLDVVTAAGDNSSVTVDLSASNTQTLTYCAYNSSGSGSQEGFHGGTSRWKLSSSRTVSFKITKCDSVALECQFTKDNTTSVKYAIGNGTATEFVTNGSDKKVARTGGFKTEADGEITITISSTNDVLLGDITFFPIATAPITDPVTEVTIAGPTRGTKDYKSTFTASTDIKADNYKWFVNDAEQAGATDKKFEFTPAAAGDYSIVCKARNANNATDEWIASSPIAFKALSTLCGELIKATLNGGNSATMTGIVGGTFDSNLGSGKYKLDKGVYAGVQLASGSFQEGDTVVITMTAAGSNYPCLFADKNKAKLLYLATETSSDLVYKIVLPSAANGESAVYLVRDNDDATYKWNPTVSAISVVRPMAIKSVVEELTNVKIDGEAISAAQLETLKADPYTLALEDSYVNAPVIKFYKNVVTTYEDDSQTIKADSVVVTATDVTSKWQAQAEINSTTYTIMTAKISSVVVTYMDGATKLGEENVAIGANPANYATYQSKQLASFVAWYNNADLAEEHKVANIAAEVINAAATYYAKFENAYATSVNIEQLVLENGKTYNLLSTLGTRNYATNWTNDLDSIDESKSNRNYPYLGEKVKAAGKMIDLRLAAGSTIKVKFGNVPNDVKVVINDKDSTVAKANLANPFEYTAAVETYMSIRSTTGSTLVFKQIMIDENIQDVVLNAKITVDGETVKGAVGFVGDKLVYPVGTEITLTNIPEEGYELDEYLVYKQGDETTVVPVTDGKFIMPNYNVVISGTFKATPATALDNAADEVKAVKRIENGQLFIEKNGVIYNAQGARLQ